MQTSGKQLSKEELERKERQKHDELRRELQKVKQRRLVSWIVFYVHTTII